MSLQRLRHSLQTAKSSTPARCRVSAPKSTDTRSPPLLGQAIEDFMRRVSASRITLVLSEPFLC
jgi:hypothetical protein